MTSKHTDSNDYVKRPMFLWIMGIFVVLFMSITGYVVGIVDKTRDQFNHNLSEVRDDVTLIKIDIAEIKTTLKIKLK